ncbi:Global transcription regulator sge1 [Exophiala xenobiotica]|nr:Global transcription regulator sge1 [Exophiala xenobiotica]KAK5243509.1 Global transcription regulator sge1 [Exophiala xenobiotica]KAK5260364.1 Global transcription regulator sge1 [Exophiala xenobiotica]KAK5344627.1 Global transcription regulator sge1 [Exophiala xenobiotica]KAK5357317.1 Global transcription regulator sge1 [Exophiala xenobiotica]
MEMYFGYHPSYRGFVETLADAFMLIQACREGRLPSVDRRPCTEEKLSTTESGNVFIFEEGASGIKRWTDGRRWSPSRKLGDFFIYRELEASGTQANAAQDAGWSSIQGNGNEAWPRPLYGPRNRAFNANCRSLIKKTISVKEAGAVWHLVSYYQVDDILSGLLKRPSEVQDFLDVPDLIPWEEMRVRVLDDFPSWTGLDERNGALRDGHLNDAQWYGLVQHDSWLAPQSFGPGSYPTGCMDSGSHARILDGDKMCWGSTDQSTDAWLHMHSDTLGMDTYRP